MKSSTVQSDFENVLSTNYPRRSIHNSRLSVHGSRVQDRSDCRGSGFVADQFDLFYPDSCSQEGS